MNKEILSCSKIYNEAVTKEESVICGHFEVSQPFSENVYLIGMFYLVGIKMCVSGHNKINCGYRTTVDLLFETKRF